MSEFEQRRQTRFPGSDPVEEEALRFAKSWHRFPGIHDAIWFRGVNLGELDDYVLCAGALKTLLHQAGRLP